MLPKIPDNINKVVNLLVHCLAAIEGAINNELIKITPTLCKPTIIFVTKIKDIIKFINLIEILSWNNI